MRELDHIIFTLDGQAICSLGKNIFTYTKLEDIQIFLSGLITGVRSFSQLLESELKTVTAIGQKQIFRIVVSPEYFIESRDDIDIEKLLLDKRLGRRLWEETVWKKEPQRGLCIGFKVVQNPFWIDFPDITQGFNLYYLREMAENFYTEFADQIRNYDLNFDLKKVKETINWNGTRSSMTTIDLGHPVFAKNMEATVIFTENNCSINIDWDLVESKMKSEALCSIAATLYTGVNHTFGFAENDKKEGWMVVDFIGTSTMGSSLFVFGKEIEKNGNTVLILAIAVTKKDKYVIGGKGDVSNIMRTLCDKAREIATCQMSKRGTRIANLSTKLRM